MRSGFAVTTLEMLNSEAMDIIDVRAGSERRRSDLEEAEDNLRSLDFVKSCRGGGSEKSMLLR